MKTHYVTNKYRYNKNIELRGKTEQAIILNDRQYTGGMQYLWDSDRFKLAGITFKHYHAHGTIDMPMTRRLHQTAQYCAGPYDTAFIVGLYTLYLQLWY